MFLSSFRFSHLLLIITSFRVLLAIIRVQFRLTKESHLGSARSEAKVAKVFNLMSKRILLFLSTSHPRFCYNVTIRWWYICCTVCTLPEPCRILLVNPLESCFSSFSFGQPSTSTATSTPSLFGSTPAPASNSLFGGGGSGTAGNPGTPTTAPASGGLFGGGGGGGLFGGGQSTAGQTQSKPAFSFGTSAPTTTPSLFGGASNAAQPATGGGGLFGSTSNTQGGGLFGQPQQQQQQQPQAGGGLFGSTNNSCVSLVSFISGAPDLSIP